MQGLVNATTACALSILSIILSKTGRFCNNTKKAIRLFTNVTLALAIGNQRGTFSQNLDKKRGTTALPGNFLYIAARG